MSDLSLQQAIDNIYASINNDNEEIDFHIAALKAAMATQARRETELLSAGTAIPRPRIATGRGPVQAVAEDEVKAFREALTAAPTAPACAPRSGRRCRPGCRPRCRRNRRCWRRR